MSDREATPLAPLLISLSSCSPFCSLSLFFFFNFICLFLLLAVLGFWGCVGFPPVAASRGCPPPLQWAGFSGQRLRLLKSSGSRAHRLSPAAPWLWSADSVAVGHGLSCYVAYGIVLDQGLNLCLPHWQADSQPLNRWGSPSLSL